MDGEFALLDYYRINLSKAISVDNDCSFSARTENFAKAFILADSTLRKEHNLLKDCKDAVEFCKHLKTFMCISRTWKEAADSYFKTSSAQFDFSKSDESAPILIREVDQALTYRRKAIKEKLGAPLKNGSSLIDSTLTWECVRRETSGEQSLPLILDTCECLRARINLRVPRKRAGRDMIITASEKMAQEGRERMVQPTAKSAKPFVSPLLKSNREENLDDKMVQAIKSEILSEVPRVSWDDIAGLQHAKNIIKETVIWPMIRPDIFTGIRLPPKGILLFGPPGTGKTLIGKFIASQCKATFFSISSSSLTSKWVGDGEKMVRTLFLVARLHQPSVIFIDEVDSLLSQRNENEIEATRRIKTEFLVQFDGCSTNSEDRILLIGATNRPQEIDEAARRRFRKKLYIPLPDEGARETIFKKLLSQQHNNITNEEISRLVELTSGYSGFDVDGLVREAALGPVRDIQDISLVTARELRPINMADFLQALTQIRASVSSNDLSAYAKFNKEYGCADVNV